MSTTESTTATILSTALASSAHISDYAPSSAVFDPAIHLAYMSPSSKLTMADIGLPADAGISPVAVTQPFPLMSLAGVRELRRDILSKDVIDKYTVSSYIAPCQSREFPREAAPFVHQVWTHPEVLRIVSDAAGVELVPMHVPSTPSLRPRVDRSPLAFLISLVRRRMRSAWIWSSGTRTIRSGSRASTASEHSAGQTRNPRCRQPTQRS